MVGVFDLYFDFDKYSLYIKKEGLYVSHYLEDKMDLIKSRIKYVCKMENEYLGEITICSQLPPLALMG